MFRDAFEVLGGAWAEGFALPLRMSISEWADEYRMLAQKSSSEPGPWRTERTPYLREIMDCLSPDHPCEKVTLVAGTQIGKTEAGNNWIGHTIDIDPCPMMVVMPTSSLAKRWSRQRLAPLIAESPTLAAKVAPIRSRDESNTTLLKDFEGGMLVIAGANSAADLRSMPVRKLFKDEIDGYPFDVDGEGDPSALAENRTDTFARRKILETSTPTTAGFSRIWSSWERSDMRRYWVPCPHCGDYQWLKWTNIRWDKDAGGNALPKTARYVCEHCGATIEERHKTQMLARGEWRAERMNTDDRHVGFHLSSLYSPLGWRSWAALVQQFVDAKHKADNGDTTLLKAFINNRLAECWEEQGDKVEQHKLAERAKAETYKLGEVPLDALVLVAAIDVQGDRLEMKVKGYREGEESWTVDYQVLHGDPAQLLAPGGQAEERVKAPYRHASGHDVHIEACAIDSGGHHTQEVYAFARRLQWRHVIAVKGASDHNRPILGKASPVEFNWRGQKIKGGAQVWMVGTAAAKSVIYGRLRIEQPGPGYCHHTPDLPAEYYEQLTSERLVTRYVKGRPKLEWVKPAGKRNEALDLEVYCLAAIWYLGMPRWPARRWQQLRERLRPDLFSGTAAEAKIEATSEESTAMQPLIAPAQPQRRIRRGGFVHGWRN